MPNSRLQAFRDNFIAGDGPFFTPGAVAASASSFGRGGAAEAQAVQVVFRNLPPGAAPLSPATSALGLEVTTDGDVDTASWVNATSATVRGNTVLVGSAVEGVRQVRYLWSDNACLGWNSRSSSRETDPAYRCPLYTAAGLPVLPFVLSLSLLNE